MAKNEKRRKSGGRDILQADEVLEKISWMRQALKVFDRLKMMDIEGGVFN